MKRTRTPEQKLRTCKGQVFVKLAQVKRALTALDRWLARVRYYELQVALSPEEKELIRQRRIESQERRRRRTRRIELDN